MPPPPTPVVWIVDDDEDDQLFLQLAFANCQPPVAGRSLNNGDELLTALADCEHLPKLILLDINMPGINGFETLAALRAEQAFAPVPVVMLTTSSSSADRQRCLALGANGFLTKPLDYSKLNELAQQLIRQWALH